MNTMLAQGLEQQVNGWPPLARLVVGALILLGAAGCFWLEKKDTDGEAGCFLWIAGFVLGVAGIGIIAGAL
jgi:hypothetical protein